MVRFSDIFGPKRQEPLVVQSEDKPQKEKLWLSESQIIKPKNGKGLLDQASTDGKEGRLQTYYMGLLEEARSVRDKVKADQGLTYSPVLSILQEIIDEGLIDQAYEFAITARHKERLLAHTVSVTLGSLKLGKGMGYDTGDLLKLGLAAFFENVGMYKIPDEILKKKEALRPEEIAIIRSHPELSAKILSQMGESFAWLAEVALQIHERSDGSGYPNGIKGDAISEFASIIGLMDTYSAMIKDRPYRNKYMEADAVKFVIEIDKGKFPSRVLKEFFVQISLFPINTYVKLNNKSIGRVVSTDRRQPLRPTIELIYDAKGRKVDKPEIIHLPDYPLLHIVGAIDESQFPD